MINILIITFLVVAIIIGFIMLSKCDVTKELEIKLDLDNKHMANAEPEEYRCCMCSKKFNDGGVFKQYKNKWYCINCYLEERKKQTESEKAGEE